MASKPFTLLSSRKKTKQLKSDVKMLLDRDTPFHIVESYKTIRTNLWYALAPHKSKAVVFSSALPSEGKSTTCSNLAITMAEANARVLVIDADMRKPTQYKIFRRPNRTGLSKVLAGLDTVADTIHKDVITNLDLITSGPPPPNPSELLSSENLRLLLSTLGEHYDYIFIDSPPINIVTDAIIIANQVAGIALITRQNQSTYDELNKAISSIEFSGTSILGLIITNVKDKNGSYSHYKYKYQHGNKS